MSSSCFSHTRITWFFGCMLASSFWTAPALADKPLVEPRPTKSDSVRARERSIADSVRATQDHLSGGTALAVGLAATLVPPAVALLTNLPNGDPNSNWEGALALGSVIGVFAGPAIGLASGGRTDLATRGLVIRGLGYAAMTVGLLGVASSFEGNSTYSGVGSGVIVLAFMGGAAVSSVSCIYDLAITSSAVGPRPTFSVGPAVDSRGRLALFQARF